MKVLISYQKICFIIRSFSLIVLISITSCQEKREPADAVIWNGLIYSGNEANDTFEAAAVKGGNILAVGTKAEIAKYKGKETQVIDLKGNFAYPGFIEGHAHIMGIGDNLVNVDLMFVKSYEELVAQVAARAAQTPKGEWILGRGWHQDKWESLPESMFRGFPTHDLLSEAVPDHPVFLKHASGHASLANAKAMEIAGIGKSTTQPAGGEIFKSLDGTPTGLLNETAQRLVGQFIPHYSEEKLIQTLKAAVQACLENGVTSFQQAGSGRKDINVFQKLAANSELDLRLYVMLDGKDYEILDQFFEEGHFYDPAGMLAIRSVKLYSDGALGSRGAWLLDEYTDARGVYGHNVTEMSEIETITRKAAEAGFQVCTHAIGDRANREVLDIYERIINEFPEKMIDHRFRVEHAQHIDPADIPRFASLGVVPAMQAIHMASDRPWAIERLGRKRIEEGAYMWQTLLTQGTKIVNGSDAPVEPINPIASFYASVARKTLNKTPESGYEPEESMSRQQALRSYTLDAAYGAFEEAVKGSIEPGKYADFTILNKDIITIPEDDILSAKVSMTIVGGKVKYQSPQMDN